MSTASFNVITESIGSNLFSVHQESDQSIPPVDFIHRILPDGTFRIYNNSDSQEVERIVKF